MRRIDRWKEKPDGGEGRGEDSGQNRKRIREATPDEKQDYRTIAVCGAYAVKTTFRHAPAEAASYVFWSLISSVCTVAQIPALRMLVDAVSGYIRGSESGGGVLLWGSLYIGTLAASSMYGFMLGKLGRYLRRRLTKSLMPAIAEKFSRIEYQYFENGEFLNVVSRMSRNPQEKVHAAFCGMVGCIMQMLTLAGILVMFFRASFWVGVGALLIGVPMSLLNVWEVSRRNHTLAGVTGDQRMGEYQQSLFSDKDAAYEIKVFRARDHILDMWQETMDKIMRRGVKIQKELVRVQVMVGLLKVAYLLFAAVSLTLGFLGGNIGLGVLVSVLQSVESLFSAMGAVSYSVTDLGKVTYEIAYLTEFLNFREDGGRGTEAAESGGEIVFDHVYFRYPGTEREILHDLSFTVKSGERLALVGVNGAGKSTVVKLLCGLYKPDRGHVYIGGKDIGSLSPQALRRYVAAVFQDFGAYQLTLRENIAFGDLSRMDEDDVLTKALSQADGGGTIKLGLDDPLGRIEEDGVDLSKGQWQRIAIARAFLSEAEFVVLDEPTASLDPLAESNVYESFKDVLGRRGTLIISHRLASARLAERILVLEGGEVVEEGSHAELMEKGGLYAVMYEEQSGWYKAG